MRATERSGSGRQHHASAGPGLAEAPAASPLAAVAPPPRGDPVAATIAGLQQALEAVRGRLDDDPYANPIALLALDLLRSS